LIKKYRFLKWCSIFRMLRYWMWRIVRICLLRNWRCISIIWKMK
jgi:hypothetical protein